jgi:hypothetical protein
MNVDEMRVLLEKARQTAKDNAGKIQMCSEKGPANFDLIEGLIQIVEQQQRELDAVKAKFIN